MAGLFLNPVPLRYSTLGANRFRGGRALSPVCATYVPIMSGARLEFNYKLNRNNLGSRRLRLPISAWGRLV